MSLVVASWMRFMNGVDEKGQAIPLNDPRVDSIQPIAKRGGESPTELLKVEEVFGDLGANERFAAEVGAALRDLYQLGARQTVKKYIA
jgi:mannitol 2-dehydrogenase